MKFFVTNVVVFHCVLAGLFAQASMADTVTVYSAVDPPYNFLTPEGEVEGVSARQVRKVLDASGLFYEIKTVPWARAIQMANLNDTSLIYTLSRVATREEDFHWLVPLMSIKSVLYGRQDDQRIIRREDIKQGKYKSVCFMMTAQCETLLKLGFPEKNIHKYTFFKFLDQYKMLMSGRVDLLMTDPLIYRYAVYTKDIGYFDIGMKKMLTFEEVSTPIYLSSGKNVSLDIRNAVTAAYENLRLSGDPVTLTLDEAEKKVINILEQ